MKIPSRNAADCFTAGARISGRNSKKKGGKNMDEARSSWNTVYQSKEGFECQITLRDEDESSLAERAKKVMASIAKSGGVPVKRRSYASGESADRVEKGANPGKPPKTYTDEKGVRRCNLKLKSGKADMALSGAVLITRSTLPRDN